MRLRKIKRVTLSDQHGVIAVLHEEFMASLPDWAILSAIARTGKTHWVGDLLYMDFTDGQGVPHRCLCEVTKMRV